MQTFGLRAACRRQKQQQNNGTGKRSPVAIFHLSAQIISRKDGRSSTAAAAYRAGELIADERTGEVHDYSRRSGVAHAEVVMPSSSMWSPTRAELWNAVEKKNKRADSQVAREFVIALPSELDADERRNLAVGFVRELADRYGIAADVAIHEPSHKGDGRNHHAHILASTNKVDGMGFGNKARELDLVAHNMGGKIGQANEIEWMRERWAAMVNAALVAHSIEAGIDHRSYQRQALAQGHDVELAPLATVHLGPQASTLERAGTRTVPGDLNREVAVINLELERTRRQARSEYRDPGGDPVSRPAERMARRHGQLRQELRDALGLSHLPTAEEVRAEIRRHRDGLSSIRARCLKESEALQRAIRDMEETRTAARKLRERERVVVGAGRKLRDQAQQHTAALRWRHAHPLRSWLHDIGLLKAPAAQLAVDPDLLQSQWREARAEYGRLQHELEAVQRRQEAAAQLRSKVQAQVEDEARRETEAAAKRIGHVAGLAEELHQVETTLQQQPEAVAQTLDSEQLDIRLGQGPAP